VGERYARAIGTAELAPGGMKAVELDGREIAICRVEGRYYAIDRRCGHMNAPLDQGTLSGTILTCAMHCAQFDVATGEALTGPVPHDWGTEPAPAKIAQHLGVIGALMAEIRTESIRVYDTKVEDGAVWVALP
jgi:nitrite reductase/ring-hydroxylating ferredoxin subunit